METQPAAPDSKPDAEPRGAASCDASLAEATAETSGDACGDEAGDAGHAERGPRIERPRKPRRDPNEPQFGGLFLDALQRSAGLRGQFGYGVPESLWRANREQTVKILREEVPMPTSRHQIQCILKMDPIDLAHDVHFEMLSAPAPVKDSFRWLWLYMMLR